MSLDNVILVDEHDNVLGQEEKLKAHLDGLLHRAFSVFIVDEAGRVLLQRRSLKKYHSGGLWSNACCGHPRPGEATIDAARRRLAEELGVDCALEPAFTFVYRASLDNGLREYEFDHVFIGRCDARPTLDAAEVSDVRWATPAALDAEMTASPLTFTVWVGPAWRGIRERLAA